LSLISATQLTSEISTFQIPDLLFQFYLLPDIAFIGEISKKINFKTRLVK
jgi:hypothetical protein